MTRVVSEDVETVYIPTVKYEEGYTYLQPFRFFHQLSLFTSLYLSVDPGKGK